MKPTREVPGGRAVVATGMVPVEPSDGKARKRALRRWRDARRPPDSYERFKMLVDVIGEHRHVVDLEDHRARYALVIMGAINATLLLVASRVVGFPRPGWLLAVGLGYLAGTFLFILTAVDCLRPRSLGGEGLLHWEGAVRRDLLGYQAEWTDARLDRLNDEAAAIVHTLAGMIAQKHRANRRLYSVLTVMIVFGAVVLLLFGRELAG